MQLIAGHSLQLKSSWDSYPSISVQPGGKPSQQPFSTWKFRSDGETKRTIDYIWYVVMLPCVRKNLSNLRPGSGYRMVCLTHHVLASIAVHMWAVCKQKHMLSDHRGLVCRYSIDERLQLTSHWQLPSEQTIGSAGQHYNANLHAHMYCRTEHLCADCNEWLL